MRRILALAFALAQGCAPDPREEQLAAAWREAKTQSATALSLAQNLGSYQADLKKQDRIFEGMGVYQRVPPAWDGAAFQSALVALARAHKLAVLDFHASARAATGRALPEVVPADKKFDLRDDDVRGVVDVRFRLAPLDVARAEQWFHGRVEVGPLLKVSALRAGPDGLWVAGETYHFLAPRWPRYVRAAPDLRALLRGAGVEDEPAALLQGRHGERLREIEAELAPVAARMDEINRALAVLSESQFRAARYAFFKRAAQEADGQSFEELMLR